MIHGRQWSTPTLMMNDRVRIYQTVTRLARFFWRFSFALSIGFGNITTLHFSPDKGPKFKCKSHVLSLSSFFFSWPLCGSLSFMRRIRFQCKFARFAICFNIILVRLCFKCKTASSSFSSSLYELRFTASKHLEAIFHLFCRHFLSIPSLPPVFFVTLQPTALFICLSDYTSGRLRLNFEFC